VGYPNQPGYLASYKGERYHLPEYHRGMEPNSPKEKFNRVHSSIRNVNERSFALWKNKWQILYKMPKYLMLTHKKRLLLLLWSSSITFVIILVEMWILLIVTEVSILCLLSQIDTTNIQCHPMPLMIQLLKQVFL
jgi:hypothetical protein